MVVAVVIVALCAIGAGTHEQIPLQVVSELGDNSVCWLLKCSLVAINLHFTCSCHKVLRTMVDEVDDVVVVVLLAVDVVAFVLVDGAAHF